MKIKYSKMFAVSTFVLSMLLDVVPGTSFTFLIVVYYMMLDFVHVHY